MCGCCGRPHPPISQIASTPPILPPTPLPATFPISLPTPDIRHADFSRILLIKPSAVGDVVHTLPVLEKLRRRYPQARIDWLLTPENAPLVRGHPAVSNILLFARREFSQQGKRLGAAASILQLVGEIRAARYQLVIDLHGQLRSGLFTMVSEAPVRIGFDRPIKRTASTFRGQPLGNIPRHGWAGAREGSWLAYTHRIPIPTLNVHAVDRYLWVGNFLGFDNDPPLFNLPISPEAEARISTHLAEHAPPGRRIAILAPGTMWETKHWTPDGFAGVARGLVEAGLTPIFIGSKSEQPLNGRIHSQVPGSSNFTGQTSLADAVALIRRAALVVTNDSGLMHIAAALGRPAISIFGPTNPVQVGPYGQPENVIRLDLPCSPCNYRRLAQCPNDHKCMRDLPVEMVMDRIREVLKDAPHALV
jgi:heptosyltransferase I